jgi:transposase
MGSMLLRATLLQALFSVRSERMSMEQINYNLLFRWLVGLPMDAEVWHPTVFTHNWDRLLEADVAKFCLPLIVVPSIQRRRPTDTMLEHDGMGRGLLGGGPARFEQQPRR